MARRVRDEFSKMPRDVHDALVGTKGLTSTQTLRKLQRKHLKPITPLSEIRQMARGASKKSKVPVKITTKLRGHPHADGVCVVEGHGRTIEKVEARIHPVLQYSTRNHVKDVINHELDHARHYKGLKTYKHQEK